MGAIKYISILFSNAAKPPMNFTENPPLLHILNLIKRTAQLGREQAEMYIKEVYTKRPLIDNLKHLLFVKIMLVD